MRVGSHGAWNEYIVTYQQLQFQGLISNPSSSCWPHFFPHMKYVLHDHITSLRRGLEFAGYLPPPPVEQKCKWGWAGWIVGKQGLRGWERGGLFSFFVAVFFKNKKQNQPRWAHRSSYHNIALSKRKKENKKKASLAFLKNSLRFIFVIVKIVFKKIIIEYLPTSYFPLHLSLQVISSVKLEGRWSA